MLVGALAGCAKSIPAKSYGVTSLELYGVDKMDDEAIAACLATQERPRTGFSLGGAEDPACGEPPFDAWRLPISLWAWPWTQWPIYDKAIFDRDLERIERWYRARGYYDARVVRVKRVRNEEDRKISLSVSVSEGEPVLIDHIDIVGIDSLDDKLKRKVMRRFALELGDVFDEALYDNGKRAVDGVLREASYAKVQVEGKVSIDPVSRHASIELEVALGPACKFGTLQVTGEEELPGQPIWAAADIHDGDTFSVSALDDAKRAIYALGPFASVEVEEHPRKDAAIVDLVIKVVPGRVLRYGVGVGMESGTNSAITGTDGTGDNFKQWDVHLLGRIEHRNFLGGLRRLSIEDRPRLIFGDSFPAVPRTDIGNLLVVQFRQPAFIEARTSLVATTRWDVGPDPFGGGFNRSDVVAGLGPERQFFDGKLTASSTLNVNLFIPTSAKPYPDYHVTYFQHLLVLDLRDVPRAPKKGAYFALTVQHAGYFLPSNWDYVRVTPEARGYLKLPLGMVLAARARLGIMEITDSSIGVGSNDKTNGTTLPDTAPKGATVSDPYGYLERLRDLGPLRQRLRGGGHNSVRGYEPNTLGDVTLIGDRLDSGGLRQWEASLELRIPITADFGAVLFTDVGDVTREKTFRFYDPQTTFGFGLRYKTIVGPLRLDAGFAPPSLQARGSDDRIREGYDAAGVPLNPSHDRADFPESHIFGAQGAIHFTIGEAF